MFNFIRIGWHQEAQTRTQQDAWSWLDTSPVESLMFIHGNVDMAAISVDMAVFSVDWADLPLLGLDKKEKEILGL